MSILNIVGNIIFVILSSRLKDNPDEYMQFLNYNRNHNLSKWNNSTGFNCMEWNEIFKGSTTTEEGFMNNCPDIMIQKPWRKLK